MSRNEEKWCNGLHEPRDDRTADGIHHFPLGIGTSTATFTFTQLSRLRAWRKHPIARYLPRKFKTWNPALCKTFFPLVWVTSNWCCLSFPHLRFLCWLCQCQNVNRVSSNHDMPLLMGDWSWQKFLDVHYNSSEWTWDQKTSPWHQREITSHNGRHQERMLKKRTW